MQTITDPMTKTAAEWREEAAGARKRSADSFARCDTDGALSQWAADRMAARYDALAQIAEEGGCWFMALADLDGNLLDARYVETRWGWAWAITTERGTDWFNESNAAKGERRRAAHARKGYRLVETKRAAVMFSDGNLAPKTDSEILEVREIAYPDW